MIPTVVKLAGCPLADEPFLIHKKLLSMKNPAALQFLTQTDAPTTIPRSKALKYFCLAHSPSMAHNPCVKENLNLAPPVHIWIEVDITGDFNKG
jgi:hypothetical protein